MAAELVRVARSENAGEPERLRLVLVICIVQKKKIE